MAPSTSRDVASINSHPISDLYASYGNTLGQPPWLVSSKTQVESQLTVSYCTTLQGNLLRSLCQKTIVLQPVYVTALCGCQVIVEWRSTRYSNPSGVHQGLEAQAPVDYVCCRRLLNHTLTLIIYVVVNDGLRFCTAKWAAFVPEVTLSRLTRLLRSCWGDISSIRQGPWRLREWAGIS